MAQKAEMLLSQRKWGGFRGCWWEGWRWGGGSWQRLPGTRDRSTGRPCNKYSLSAYYVPGTILSIFWVLPQRSLSEHLPPSKVDILWIYFTDGENWGSERSSNNLPKVTEFTSTAANTGQVVTKAPCSWPMWGSQAHCRGRAWRAVAGREARRLFLALLEMGEGKKGFIVLSQDGEGGIWRDPEDQAGLCGHDTEPSPEGWVCFSRQRKSIASGRNSLRSRQILKCAKKVPCVFRCVMRAHGLRGKQGRGMWDCGAETRGKPGIVPMKSLQCQAQGLGPSPVDSREPEAANERELVVLGTEIGNSFASRRVTQARRGGRSQRKHPLPPSSDATTWPQSTVNRGPRSPSLLLRSWRLGRLIVEIAPRLSASRPFPMWPHSSSHHALGSAFPPLKQLINGSLTL